MQWELVGTDRAAGGRRTVTVEADGEAAAAALCDRHGLTAVTVRPPSEQAAACEATPARWRVHQVLGGLLAAGGLAGAVVAMNAAASRGPVAAAELAFWLTMLAGGVAWLACGLKGGR